VREGTSTAPSADQKLGFTVTSAPRMKLVL
jgi:hypothetical protein